MFHLMHGDCLELMKGIPDGSVDMILCDLPYGTTACKWDSVIPFDPLWEQYRRVTKKNAAIVLFGSEPFSSVLRASNIDWFKYDWVWQKNKGANVMQAKNAPLKVHEMISIFSSFTIVPTSIRKMPYNPQGLIACEKKYKSVMNKGGVHGNRVTKEQTLSFTNYPRSVIRFDLDASRLHPTQKPVALIEYLIRTYTNEGETVLDNCMGSGTTGVACANTNRKFIGIEKDDGYFAIAKERIENAHKTKSTVLI